MRLDSNYVRLHIVQELTRTPYAKIRYDDFDVIVVDLEQGHAAAINIMEREMPLHDIRSIYDDHQRQNIHTVFLLWCEMLVPEHGDIFEPPQWLEALHALHNNKIYAYKTIGDEVYIFPVTFEAVGVGNERLVKYGNLIDVKDLGCAFIEVTGADVTGTWRMADFVPGRGKANAERVYRTKVASDAEKRRRREQFRQHYEETHQQQTPQSQAAHLLVHYKILGVAVGSNWDTIKKAYRELARQYHPDLNPSPAATARMQEINAAYAFLMQRFDDGTAA